MIKFFILVALLFSHTSYRQDRKYNCVKRSNLTLKERLSHYPFNIAKEVMLVSFDDSFGYLPVNNDTVCISKLTETKMLDNNQVDSLTNLLYNIGVKGNTFKYTPAACYFPRNAILFLDSTGKAAEFIEICFECNRTRQSSENFENGISCNEKFQMLKSFFAQQGIKYGTADH